MKTPTKKSAQTSTGAQAAKAKVNRRGAGTSRVAGRSAARVDTGCLDQSLGYSLRRAQLSTFQDFAVAMRKLEVRPSHYAVLVLIGANPGLTQSAVSTALGIQKANFVTLLDGLEGRGLTERRKVGGDRRSSALYLTRAGEVFVRKMVLAHDGLEARLAARLGERKTQQLLTLLHQFCSAEE